MALIKNAGPIGVYMYVAPTHEKQDPPPTPYGQGMPYWADIGYCGGVINSGASRYIQADLISKFNNEPVYVTVVSTNSDLPISYCQISPHDLAVFNGIDVKVDNGYTGKTEPRHGW